MYNYTPEEYDTYDNDVVFGEHSNSEPMCVLVSTPCAGQFIDTILGPICTKHAFEYSNSITIEEDSQFNGQY